MDFAAIDSAVEGFYAFINKSESALYDRLCVCEDDAEIDELFSILTNMDRVNVCARALGLKAVIDGDVVPAMALLAQTCSICMEGSSENVPWAELAGFFDRAIAVTCVREGAQVDPTVLEEMSVAVERRLAENRLAEERRAAEAEAPRPQDFESVAGDSLWKANPFPRSSHRKRGRTTRKSTYATGPKMDSSPQLIFHNLLIAARAEWDRAGAAMRLSTRESVTGPLLLRRRRVSTNVRMLEKMCAASDDAVGSELKAPAVTASVAIGCVWMAMKDGPSRDAAAAVVSDAIDRVRLGEKCFGCGLCPCRRVFDDVGGRAISALG
jgi:hypothetical protein